MQGLEPLDSFSDVINLINLLRTTYDCLDDIVIYTGYNKKEIEWFIKSIKHFKNIILKYGRYIPNQESHLDSILGVKLSSSNQYAEKIS
jgi:MinD-like ATPase involved in chromosome partitioning or flagellar assembly